MMRTPERFPAKWTPVRRQKARQIKNLERGSDAVIADDAPGLSARLARLTVATALALSAGACASGRNMMLAGSGGDQAAYDEVFDEEVYDEGPSGDRTVEAAGYEAYGQGEGGLGRPGRTLVRSGNAPMLGGGGPNGLTATATGAVRTLTPLLGAAPGAAGATVNTVVATVGQTTAGLAPATGAATGLVAAAAGALPAAGNALNPVSATAAGLGAPIPVAGTLVRSTATTATLTERPTAAAAANGTLAAGAISTTTATVRALPGPLAGGLQLGR